YFSSTVLPISGSIVPAFERITGSVLYLDALISRIVRGLPRQPQAPFGWQRAPVAQRTPLHVHAPDASHENGRVVPASQLGALTHLQTAPTHLRPGAQARPQAPQLAGSVAKFLHPAGVWQHDSPAAHAPRPLQEQTSPVALVMQTSLG